MPNARIVFCGMCKATSPSLAETYYEQPGDKFWTTLHKVGLTPAVCKPVAYRQLMLFGLGLADLKEEKAGLDHSAKFHENYIRKFTDDLITHAPFIVAFNGKKAASLYFSIPTKKLSYGLQTFSIGNSKVFILPSTANSASKFWNLTPWQDIALLAKQRPKSIPLKHAK